jgi:hypothetical protein
MTEQDDERDLDGDVMTSATAPISRRDIAA